MPSCLAGRLACILSAYHHRRRWADPPFSASLHHNNEQNQSFLITVTSGRARGIRTCLYRDCLCIAMDDIHASTVTQLYVIKKIILTIHDYILIMQRNGTRIVKGNNWIVIPICKT